MQVTEADVARIPRTNLRVPVAEFAQVWRGAEVLGVDDWYGAGVAVTCRWLATAVVRPEDGRRWYPARAPVTKHTHVAYEELIQAEYAAAEKLGLDRPALYDSWPGWIDGVCATFRWVWARTGPPPLALGDTARA